MLLLLSTLRFFGVVADEAADGPAIASASLFLRFDLTVVSLEVEALVMESYGHDSLANTTST